MDVFDAISRRHSYRGGFTDKEIPRADLTKIVEAGLHAPSGCNAQTTSFVIVDDKASLAAVSALFEKAFVREAKAMIVCVVDHREVYKGSSFAVEDCAAAVENILLAVTALGYATVWLDGALRGGRDAKIAEILGVPVGKQVRVLLPIGVPKEAGRQPEKLPFEKRAWFNRYGNT